MKEWKNAEIAELTVNSTEHRCGEFWGTNFPSGNGSEFLMDNMQVNYNSAADAWNSFVNFVKPLFRW